MHPLELLKRIKEHNPPVIVDVRTFYEFRNGYIQGAVHAPAWKILFCFAKIPSAKNAELVVTCEHGPRAIIVKSLLIMYGYRNVSLVAGQMTGWRKYGLPLEY